MYVFTIYVLVIFTSNINVVNWQPALVSQLKLNCYLWSNDLLAIRLTPPYMLWIMVYVTTFKYWNSGPLWSQTGVEQNDCQDTWWKNILYINNIVEPDNMVYYSREYYTGAEHLIWRIFCACEVMGPNRPVYYYTYWTL